MDQTGIDRHKPCLVRMSSQLRMHVGLCLPRNATEGGSSLPLADPEKAFCEESPNGRAESLRLSASSSLAGPESTGPGQ